ncbi:MAG: putative F420-dependent oxidoreductase [Halioglobus sp.]|jgi:probable F420-dependent oxidoreductase
MKFGLAFGSAVAIDGAAALELCKTAESVGFESVWAGEHVIIPSKIDSPYPYTEDGKIPAQPDTPIPDPLIWLAYAAACAPTLRLGTCILILPQRNPLILAKELATLDRLSGGRVELGIGVGWMKEEFDALGLPWEARGARSDEYVEAMRLLWSGPEVEFHGRFVDFDVVTSSPRPTGGNIPIIVGGDTERALNRAARLADGYFPGSTNAEQLKGLIDSLHGKLKEKGRDPKDVEISAIFGEQMTDPKAGVAQMTEIGVGRLMVPAFFFAGEGGIDRLAEFGETVIKGV